MRILTELGHLDARVIPGPGPGLGPGPVPVAVLWHSMFTDSRSWDRVVDDLRQHRTLVLVDGWSFGSSADLPHVVEDFIGHCARAAVNVVAEVQRDVAPGPVDWVGSAWGGHVGLQLAATRPDLVRSLVTISTPIHAASSSMRRQVQLLLPIYRMIGMRGPVRRGLLEAMLSDRSRSHDPEAADALVGPMRGPSRRAIARTVHSGVLNRKDLSGAAAQIQCPTLMIATDDRGEWSPSECAEAAAMMKDTRSAVLTGSRALPSLECPGELAAMVTDFWAMQLSSERPTPA